MKWLFLFVNLISLNALAAGPRPVSINVDPRSRPVGEVIADPINFFGIITGIMQSHDTSNWSVGVGGGHNPHQGGDSIARISQNTLPHNYPAESIPANSSARPAPSSSAPSQTVSPPQPPSTEIRPFYTPEELYTNSGPPITNQSDIFTERDRRMMILRDIKQYQLRPGETLNLRQINWELGIYTRPGDAPIPRSPLAPETPTPEIAQTSHPHTETPARPLSPPPAPPPVVTEDPQLEPAEMQRWIDTVNEEERAIPRPPSPSLERSYPELAFVPLVQRALLPVSEAIVEIVTAAVQYRDIYDYPRIRIPYGDGWASQEMTAEAIALREQVQSGAPLYRLGTRGRSAEGPDAQFWSLRNPSTFEGFGPRHAMPLRNYEAANFIERARMSGESNNFVVRRVAPFEDPLTGEIFEGDQYEVVVPRNGGQTQGHTTEPFTPPTPPPTTE